MNRQIAAMMIGTVLGVSAVHAEDRHQPDQAQGEPRTAMGQGAGMTGMGMMDREQAQTRMQEMQKLIRDIDKTSDPKDRQRLMQAHMERMHDMMVGMRGMMGPGMMSPGAMGEGVTGKGMMGEGMMGEGMMGQGMMGQGMMGQGDDAGRKAPDRRDAWSLEQRQRMMEQRMDMMQGMMEQMMEQMMRQQRQGQGGMKR